MSFSSNGVNGYLDCEEVDGLMASNCKRYVLNTLGIFSFLPGLGEVVINRDKRFLFTWLLFPMAFLLWRVSIRVLFGGNEVSSIMIVSLLLATLFAYPIVALLPLIIDGFQGIRKVKKGDALIRDSLHLFVWVVGIFGWIPVWVATVLFPIASNSRDTIHPNAWIYMFIFAVAIIAVALAEILSRGQKFQKREYIIQVLLPIVGLHGAGYLLEKNVLKGTIFLIAGILLIGAIFWIPMIDIYWPVDGLLLFHILLWIPIAYFSLWMWAIVDQESMVQCKDQDLSGNHLMPT